MDTTAPDLALSSPAAGEQLTETDQPLVYGSIASDSPRNLTFSASVNGRSVTTAKGRDATTPAELEASYGEAAAGTTSALEVDGKRFALSVGTLPQGRNRITVSVRDRAGNLARQTTVVNVNSSEEFGAADLAVGAKGADVVSLQERLREAKVYPKKAKLSGRLDAVTVKSVSRYQKRYDLPITGVVDARTRTAMIGRIVVNIGQRKLRLIRNGRVWKTYGIAVGQPAYPTPTGEYDDQRQAGRSGLVPAGLALGGRAEQHPGRPGQPARHPLDRHDRSGDRHPRDLRRLVHRLRREPRLHADAHPGRRGALRAGRGRHVGVHPRMSGTGGVPIELTDAEWDDADPRWRAARAGGLLGAVVRAVQEDGAHHHRSRLPVRRADGRGARQR